MIRGSDSPEDMKTNDFDIKHFVAFDPNDCNPLRIAIGCLTLTDFRIDDSIVFFRFAFHLRFQWYA